MHAINKKISLIILLFTFTCSLYLLNGSIDEFAAINFVPSNEIIKESYIPSNTYYASDTPSFYTFGALISEISGLPVKNFIFLPITLVPYIYLFFTLMYRFSNNYIIASLVTFVEMISTSTGTFRAFLWPHGLGCILLYSSLLIFPHYITKGQMNFKRKPEFCCLLIVCGFSMVFLSYDYFAYLFSLLISLIFILLIWFTYISDNKQKSIYLNMSRQIINLLLILIVIEFGLSNFFYSSFASSLKSSQSIGVSVFDKFITSYLHQNETSSDILQLLVHYPNILSHISLVKYLCLIISISIFILLMLNKMNQKCDINIYDIITLSVIGMNFLYGLARTYIGQIPITLVFFPGIFCTLWLYRFSDKYKNWAILVVFLLIVLTPAGFFIKYDGHIDKDLNRYSYTNYPAYWYHLNKGDFEGVSDEMSKDFVLLYISENPQYFTYNTSFDVTQQKTKILSIDDALFLIQTNKKIEFPKYYIINYRLNAMSLQNWVIIKSWKDSQSLIESNVNINKIYNTDAVSIYSHHDI